MPKSPLRYPGGKQKAISQISRCIPQHFQEFREPFVGGGAVLFHVLRNHPQIPCWINDLNPELYYFWATVQTNLTELVGQVQQIKANSHDGRLLFKELATVAPSSLSDLERAARFFVLNRITFSGTIESGGYSQASFTDRFTESSINRLAALAGSFNHTKITNLDYSDLLEAGGEDVFIFLDPPYLSKTHSRLYGKKGALHTKFDHHRFAETVKQCQHKWLITYDDCPEIRANFADYYIYEWELQYGMNNYKQATAKKGKELFITNFDLDPIYNLENLEKSFEASFDNSLRKYDLVGQIIE